MKKKALKTARNIAISIVILLAVLIGAGVAYTFYMGQTDTPKLVSKPEAVKKETITHVKLAKNVPASASIQSLTTPVMPGDNASVIAKTVAGSTCTIKVEYNKVASTDSGLKQKTSDEFGSISWSWTVEPTVPEGKWPVTITCAYQERTAVVIGDLVVSNTPPTE